mgnify:CR=1 FL=1
MEAYAENRKARFNNEILDTIEAGLALTGKEVKSVRKGNLSLQGSYATIKDGEAWLLNADITPYQAAAGTEDPDRRRTRKILLNRKQIDEILRRMDSERIVIVPLSVYPKARYIKLSLGIGHPRKSFDKRETIKKRDIGKEIGKRIK